MFEQLWQLVEPAVPAGIVLAGTIGVVLIVRVILRRAARGRGGLPFRRQIVSSLLVLGGVFAFVVALPVDREIRAQILSVLGILISAVIALSSTSFVGNAMAGLMIRIVRGFRPGDFVRVGEVFGRVSDQGLFHTEIQTIRRDLVTVPNLYMIQHPVHVTRAGGTFVSASLSLGYDVAHEDAEAALKVAAEHAGLEEPFVMINEILDHAIEYEVFGLLKDTKHLLTSRSALRKAALDSLHEAGIEVLSPQFVNRREYESSKRFAPQRRQASGEDTNVAGEPEQAEETAAGAGEARDEEAQTGQRPDASAEELAFDKAEEAESIERLKNLRVRLSKDREDLEEKAKEASEKPQREDLRSRAEATRKKIERVDELIAHREEEREQADEEQEA